MRKYVKPEMVMEEIEMNQAIANCYKRPEQYFQQYGNRAVRYTNGYVTAYVTYEEAASASSGDNRVCSAYSFHFELDRKTWTQTLDILWEDWNNNGVADDGDNYQALNGLGNDEAAKYVNEVLKGITSVSS